MTAHCPKCKAENPGDSIFCAKCGTRIGESGEKPIPTQTMEVSKEELTTGSTFARRYQIIKELGKGCMGKVYRALDKKLNEEVALKLIQSIRDEAHRFAISYHRRRRRKKSFVSLLDNIQGIGPKRKALLLREFKGMEGIKKATRAQLAK